MRTNRRLAAAIVAAMLLASAASAQDGAAPAKDEKSLRALVDSSEGKAKGAAAADLALFLERDSRWSEAASAWRQARKLRGDVGDLEGEARALLAFAEDVSAQGESGGAVAAAFEDARTALRRARDGGSRSVEVAIGLARCAEISGDTATRVAELTAAVAAAPDDVRASWALAAALASEGKTDAAIAIFRKLSDAHPKDANLALALHDAAKTAGDDALQQSSAARMISAAPDDVRGWNALWHTFAPKQRWGELAGAAVELAKANPGGTWAARYAGMACSMARRFDDALEWLDKAWERQKTDSLARSEAARILMNEKKDRDRAVLYYTEALAADPASAKAYDGLFFIAKRYTDEGNPKASVPLFEILARARPKDPQAQNNHANSLRFAGRYDESEKAYLATIARFPADGQLRNDYALLLDVLGRNDEAMKVLAEAHDLDPANNDSMENLGFLARAKGDRDAALKWFRMAHATLVARGEDDHKHRINVDDQRWPLPPVR